MVASHQLDQSGEMLAQSHPSRLNPQTQSFSLCGDPNQAGSKALVRYDSVDDENHDQNISRQLQNLAESYGDEILSLRKDVERLKQGGWTVTFGSPQRSGTLDSSALEVTRKRLETTHKSITAPIYTEDHPSSRLKVIEAPPQENHEALGSSGMALSRFSRQKKVTGNNNRAPTITPSGGLGLSRYAPKAPMTCNQSSHPVSVQFPRTHPSHGGQPIPSKPIEKPNISQTNGNQAGAIKSNGTQNPQTKSNDVKLQANNTETSLPKDVKFEFEATKEPSSDEHGGTSPLTKTKDVQTQTVKAEAPLRDSVHANDGVTNGLQSIQNGSQTSQSTSNAAKCEAIKAEAPMPENVDVDCGATTQPESNQYEDPHTAVPTTEDPFAAFIKRSPEWQPLGVRRLAPLSAEHLQAIPTAKDTITFSWDFIRDLFGGKQWSPGFYYKETKAGFSILPSRSYYILDASLDPYLPKQPGMHGAKLTPYFNPENPEDVDGEDGAHAFERVPVFIATPPAPPPPAESTANKEGRHSKHYRYFGMYSQPRYSDKLDYDRMIEAVPHSVKMHWATALADPSRPPWATAMLKAHVGNDETKPEYDGPMPDGTAAGCDRAEFKNEVLRWVGQLKAWSKRASKHVSRLSKEAVLAAFEREDTAAPPGLRLWWEYLACDEWDAGFYGMLIHEQIKFERRRSGDLKFKQHSVDRSALDMMEEFPTS